MMVTASDMRWPRLRSPDELRAFYSIVLHPENDFWRGSAQGNESESISYHKWSSSGSVGPHSSSSSSLLSGQACTASSATSVSDSKTVASLAPRARHENRARLLTSHESYYRCSRDVHSHLPRAGLVLEEEDSDFVSQSRQDHAEAVTRKRFIGTCTSHLQWVTSRYEFNNRDSDSDQQVKVSEKPDLEETSWLDSLREHPYYNLDGDRKLGRVGVWAVKKRHHDARTITSHKQGISSESDAGIVREVLLLKESPLPSNDEAVHIIDDAVEDAASLMGSSKSTLAPCCSRGHRLGSSRRTLLLDLGAGSSLKSSLDTLCLDDKSVDTSSRPSLHSFSCTQSDDAEEEISETSVQPTVSETIPRSFYCTFCFGRFENQADWAEHERSQHIAKQRDWICMPWGAIEELENGKEICVFCGLMDPSPSHLLQHNEEPCCHDSVSNRTYNCREDLQEHLRKVHKQHTMTEWMEKWSYPADEEDWYWQCGFCEHSLVGWTDRVRHIGRHFRKGSSMASWDPSVPSCPIDRSTGLPVACSPSIEMDRRKLLAVRLQQFELLGISHEHLDRKRCRHCAAYFYNEEDTLRHEELWHLPRDVWLCPIKNDARTATHLQTGPLATYLFPDATPSTVSNLDVCPYCGRCSEDIFYDLDESIDECFADWEVRMEHLMSKHHFDKCQADLVFHRPDQFLLHMVCSHNLELSNWTKEVMDSCKRRKSISPDMITMSLDDAGEV